MKLRQQLEKHGYSHSFTTDEKGQFNVEASKQLICVFWFKVTVDVTLVFQIQRSSLLSSCTIFLHWILYSNCTDTTLPTKYYFPLHTDKLLKSAALTLYIPLPFSSADGKVQESYCYQIFLDQNHSLVLPTVQQLLEHSFHTAGLKLAEVRLYGFLLHSSYLVSLINYICVNKDTRMVITLNR